MKKKRTINGGHSKVGQTASEDTADNALAIVAETETRRRLVRTCKERSFRRSTWFGYELKKKGGPAGKKETSSPVFVRGKQDARRSALCVRKKRACTAREPGRTRSFLACAFSHIFFLLAAFTGPSFPYSLPVLPAADRGNYVRDVVGNGAGVAGVPGLLGGRDRHCKGRQKKKIHWTQPRS